MLIKKRCPWTLIEFSLWPRWSTFSTPKGQTQRNKNKLSEEGNEYPNLICILNNLKLNIEGYYFNLSGITVFAPCNVYVHNDIHPYARPILILFNRPLSAAWMENNDRKLGLRMRDNRWDKFCIIFLFVIHNLYNAKGLSKFFSHFFQYFVIVLVLNTHIIFIIFFLMNSCVVRRTVLSSLIFEQF